MDFRVLLSLFFVYSMTAPLLAEPIAASKPQFEPKSEKEQRAIDVLHEWSAENSTCTSVRVEFRQINYDDVFRVQKHGKGQFGYLGPRHGFWRIEPARLDPSSVNLKQTGNGISYRYKDTDSWHMCYQKTHWISINEDEKYYEEWFYANKPKQKQKGFLGLFDFIYDMSVDWPHPFLPGVPNQAIFNELLNRCWFKVIHETETHIVITGKMQHDSPYSKMFNEFKLNLDKDPWTLKATQYIHPSGNQSTVYVFSNIEMNPEEWDEPDLAGYQNRSIKYENPFK